MGAMIGSPLLLGGDAGAPSFTTERSVRLRSSASAYLTRTTATAGNRKTWTWSGWVKRGSLGGTQTLFANNFNGSGGLHYIQFNSDTLFMYVELSTTIKTSWATTAVFRDPSAWYHIVVVFDTTQSVVANMGKVYVNGVLQNTTIANYSASYISQNADGWINASGYAHCIASARTVYTNQDFDGYLTEINFVDGQALTPSSFGEYDSVRNTQWKPKEYSGSWGTNGFYLKFSDNSSATALGYDYSTTSYSDNLRSSGTNIGTFTANGGLASAFDGNTNQANASSAKATTPAAGYNSAVIGKDWGSGVTKTITAVRLFSQNDGGFVGGTTNALTFKLQGSNDNSSWTDLTSPITGPATGAGTVISVTSGITTTTAYRYHRINVNANGGDNYYICELEFYEAGTHGFNNWTPSAGISLTSGATYDSMLDVPTLTSESASNFCVLNPVSTNVSGIVPQQGNLYLGSSATYNYSIVGTIGVSSGKWYWECKTDSGFSMVGITSLSSLPLQIAPHQLGSLAKIIYAAAAAKYDNGTSSAYGATWTSADTIGIALDMDAGTLTFYKNGTSLGVAFTGLTGIYYPVFGGPNSYNHGWINFGQRPFQYSNYGVDRPAATFKTLNTYNLLEPAIDSPDDYHKVYTYTGNGGGQQVGEIQKPLSLYNLDRSLRFKGTNSYFDKVFASGGANTKGTFSFWVKRGKLAVQQELIRFGTTGTLFSGLLFNASDQLAFLRLNSTYQVNLVTTRVFRDPNAWYHIVVAWDSTLGPSSNSVKIYINGIQETVFTSSTYPSASLDMYFFTAGTHNIGRYPVGGNYFGGYMAEFHAVDGTQLTANDFGQFDGNYYWTPKDYTGGYGTNGWHLDFEDFSSMSATGIGKDVSGLGNNFTPYNFNVTVPANTNADWDSMVDVPTSTSTDVANFCVLDPIAPDKNISGTGGVYSDGNLKIAANGAASDAIVATGNLGCANGKFYAEVTCITAGSGGAQTTYAAVNIFGSGSAVYLAYDKSGQYYNGTAWTAGWSSWTANDTIGISIDQTVTPTSVSFYKNGTLQGTLTTISTSNLTFAVRAAYAASFAYNFGQRPFRYTPPTGFKSLNSFNVAEVTGDLESPDFVWIKSRSAGTDHALFNSVVGAGKYIRTSNNTTGEITDVNSIIQFNKNGFLLGNAAIVNASAATFVASAWKVAATTVTNNNGTISSQVRANPTAGISIVTWTGNNVNNSTIGHGFSSQTPKVIFAKRKDAGSNWVLMHSALATDNNLFLSAVALTQPLSAISGGGISTAVSPTTFTVKQGTTDQTNVNGSGLPYIAYCFAEVPGFSKFTSYAANGSSTGDGPYVVCGFAPRWIMIKRATGSTGTGGWIMYDTARSTYNTMSEYLFAEGPAGGNTLAAIDVTANGFKIKTNNVHLNQTANDIYIVMAFAEHPFKYALAR